MMDWLRTLLSPLMHCPSDIAAKRDRELAIRAAVDAAALSRERTQAYRREDATRPRVAG